MHFLTYIYTFIYTFVALLMVMRGEYCVNTYFLISIYMLSMLFWHFFYLHFFSFIIVDVSRKHATNILIE